MYQALFYSDFTKKLCSSYKMIAVMTEVELALVKAQEDSGIIPKGSSAIIERVFKNFDVDLIVLEKGASLVANAAVPLVKQLTAEVAREDPDAAKYVHLGATSQDVVDTATVLKAKHYLTWLHDQMSDLETALLKLIEDHRQTIMIGRTLMQQARPITFGLKAVLWLQGLRSSRQYLRFVQDRMLCIQLGGAVGSQNKFLTNEVRQAFADYLGLRNVSGWHTQRVNIAAFACALCLLGGVLGKIARDITLLSQTEVGEVFEPPAKGRGTSSTMPHKRNPVLCTAILANTHRIPFLVATISAAMPQEHERSAGLWQAEWETLDDIMGLTAGGLEKSIELLSGLEVNKERMRHNIELTKGLIFAETVSLALAEKLGKAVAHDLIGEACGKAIEQNRHLSEVLEEQNMGLSKNELEQLFRPENAIGHSISIIDEILATE